MLQFIASILFAQVQIISEPSATPTLAPAECRCSPGEPCQCGDGCTCHVSQPAESKPVISVLAKKPVIEPARYARVNNDQYAPITLAPVPDDINDHPDLIAFKEQYKDLDTKRIEPARAYKQANSSPAAVAQAPAPVSPERATYQPPAYQPQPIERAAMVPFQVCDQYGCRTEYRPVSQQPTKQAQSQQRRRGLLGLRRW